MATFEHWLHKIATLRVDRARGDPAPHKPLLLLVVFDLAENGLLRGNALALSPELAFRFCNYWSVVAHRRTQRPDVRLPFHHLQSDGFWSALDDAGQPSAHRSLTRFAEIPSDFLRFAQDPASRDKARRLILATYFRPSERLALAETLGLPVKEKGQVEVGGTYQTVEDAKCAGREARFRVMVVSAYDFTCALCGQRLTTISAGSIVDAAHIHPFSDSRNNDPRNGIALCKNAHWLFDHGLWTVSDDYRVVVAVGTFSESSPDGPLLEQYHGRSLRLPRDESLWPGPIYLSWHRKHRFQAC